MSFESPALSGTFLFNNVFSNNSALGIRNDYHSHFFRLK